MEFKFTKKLRSSKNEFYLKKKEHIYKFITENPNSYECLFGATIPYYEFDFKYESELERIDKYDTDLKQSYESITLKYNNVNAKIFSFDASGYDPIKKYWKNSFHYRIRGCGFYESSLDIPFIVDSDDSVYKKTNSRQLMRLPYCTKIGNNRPLVRIIPETCTTYKIDELSKLNEKLEDYIIQNIKNEVKIPNQKKEKEILKLENIEIKELSLMIENDEILNIVNQNGKSYTIQYIKLLCECLNIDRFNDRIHWLRFIRCLKNIGITYNLETVLLAHNFSKLSDKYNKDEIDEFFNRNTDAQGMFESKFSELTTQLKIGSLCYWAKSDNPIMYDGIKDMNTKDISNKLQDMIDCAIASPRKYTFSDYTEFVSKKLKDETDLIKYLCDTVVHIIDGGNHKIFTRNVMPDKSIKYNSIMKPSLLFFGPNNFNLSIKNVNMSMNEAFMKYYYHKKTYSFLDFIPFLKNNPTPKTIFNLFQGFQYQYNRMDVSITPPELDIIFYHIKEIICNNEPHIYEYMINYISHMFQKPNEKPGVAILLQSDEQGTGKNRFTDFLMNVIGVDNCYKANKIEDVCSKFNYHMQGKLFVVGDEIANYASHKFADILKALITEVNKSIEPKGRDSYIIHSFERYLFTSNNDFAFRVDKDGRRLLPLKVNPKKKGDFEYFNKLSEATDDIKIQELFFNYMASRDISQWNFRKIPYTKMKSDLILESLDNTIHFIIDYINEGMFTKENNIIESKILLESYNEYCKINNYKACNDRKFTKDLKSICISKNRIMKCGRRVNVFEINVNTIQNKIVEITKNFNFQFDINIVSDEPVDSDDDDS